jgi:hypothetical protein
MADMQTGEELAHHLLSTVGADDRFKKRLGELTTARKDAEAAIADAKEQVREALKDRALHERRVAEIKDDLAKSQANHDKSANEAAARIDLARHTMAEALRIQAENKAKEGELHARENELIKQIRELNQKKAVLAAQVKEAADIKAAWKERQEKLREIIG